MFNRTSRVVGKNVLELDRYVADVGARNAVIFDTV